MQKISSFILVMAQLQVNIKHASSTKKQGEHLHFSVQLVVGIIGNVAGGVDNLIFSITDGSLMSQI